MSTHQEITNGRILGWLNAETEAQARDHAEPEPKPYVPEVRGGLHGDVHTAFSWLLQGHTATAMSLVANIDDPDTITVAITAAAELAIMLRRRGERLRELAALPRRADQLCGYCGNPDCTERFDHARWNGGNETVIRMRAEGMKP